MTPIKILECLSFQLNEPWNWNPGAVSTEIPKNTCKSNRHVHIYFEWLIPLLLHPCKTNSLASFFSPDHPFWQNFDLHKQNLYSSMSSTVPHSPPPDRPDGLSENSRTLSANTLKDRLSKLTIPLNNVVNPVAALHANVKCVCFMCISFFFQIYPNNLNLFYYVLQLRSSTDPVEKEVADACGRYVVCDDNYN